MGIHYNTQVYTYLFHSTFEKHCNAQGSNTRNPYLHKSENFEHESSRIIYFGAILSNTMDNIPMNKLPYV